MATAKVHGYLPQDRPPLAALISLGFQHVLTMFPATALVARRVPAIATAAVVGILLNLIFLAFRPGEEALRT